MPSIGQTTPLASSDPVQGMASAVLPVVIVIGFIVAGYVLLPKMRVTKCVPPKLLALASVVSLGLGVSFLVSSASSTGLGEAAHYGWLLIVVAALFGVAVPIYGGDKPTA